MYIKLTIHNTFLAKLILHTYMIFFLYNEKTFDHF